MKLRWILIFVGVSLVLILSQLYIKSRKTLVASIGTSAQTNTSEADQAPAATQKTIEELKGQVKKLAKSDGCEQGRPNLENFFLMREKIQELMREESTWLLLPRGEACIELNSIYPIKVLTIDPESLKNFHDVRVGTARVLEMKSLPVAVIRENIGNEVDAQEIRILTTRLKRIKQKNDVTDEVVLVVKIKMEQIQLAQDTYAAPQSHPAAKLITSREGQTNLEGMTIIDVRPAAHFNAGAIRNAINVPAGNYLAINTRVLPPQAQENMGANIALNRLPKEKNKSLVVYSNGPYDFASYNVISELASAGYTNLNWLRGGYDEWKGLDFTPIKISTVRYVTADEVVQLMAKPLLIVDVRNAGYFQKMNRAIDMPLFVKLDARGVEAIRGQAVTLANLQKEKEIFMRPIHFALNQPILIYGQDEFDNRANKAALLLGAAGASSIYILKGGFNEWRHYSFFLPNDYPSLRVKGDLPARNNRDLNRGK